MATKANISSKGYVVYVNFGDKGSRYIWDATEIEDGGLCDLPNGYDDLMSKDDAEQLLADVKEYIAEHGYTLTAGVEEVKEQHTVEALDFDGQHSDRRAEGTLQYAVDGELKVVTGEFNVKNGRIEHIITVDERDYMMSVNPENMDVDVRKW